MTPGGNLQDAALRDRAAEREHQRLHQQQHAARRAGRHGHDAAGRERQTLRAVGAGRLRPNCARNDSRSEQRAAGQQQHPAGAVGAVAANDRRQHQQPGPERVVQGQQDEPRLGFHVGRENHADGKRAPRRDEIDRMRREGQRTARVEREFAELIKEQPPRDREITSRQPHEGQCHPAIAQEEQHRRQREQQIRREGEAHDRVQRGAYVGEDERQQRQRFRRHAPREIEDIDRPEQQDQSAGDRIGHQLPRRNRRCGVEREVKAAEARGHERLAVGRQAAALQAPPQGDEDEADRAHQCELPGAPQQLVQVEVGVERDERQDEKKRPEARQPAADAKFHLRLRRDRRQLGRRNGRKVRFGRRRREFGVQRGRGHCFLWNRRQRRSLERRRHDGLPVRRGPLLELAKPKGNIGERAAKVFLLRPQPRQQVAILGGHPCSTMSRNESRTIFEREWPLGLTSQMNQPIASDSIGSRRPPGGGGSEATGMQPRREPLTQGVILSEAPALRRVVEGPLTIPIIGGLSRNSERSFDGAHFRALAQDDTLGERLSPHSVPLRGTPASGRCRRPGKPLPDAGTAAMKGAAVRIPPPQTLDSPRAAR